MIYKKPDPKEIATGLKEYNLNPDDLFTKDSLKVRLVKKAILKSLTPGERSILLTYAECGSVRKTRDVLDNSDCVTSALVRSIKKKVLREYEELKQASRL